ncbi:MAG: rod-binding protein [Sporomusaceae bacterium]|nr:rod-binding protein [Sporomusaceae bacterium]
MDIRSIGGAQLQAPAQSAEDKKLKAACRDMEAVFLNLLLSRMRATVPKNDLTGSKQEEIVQSLLDSELTKNMAGAGGAGLADMLYRQLAQPALQVRDGKPGR